MSRYHFAVLCEVVQHKGRSTTSNSSIYPASKGSSILSISPKLNHRLRAPSLLHTLIAQTPISSAPSPRRARLSWQPPLRRRAAAVSCPPAAVLVHCMGLLTVVVLTALQDGHIVAFLVVPKCVSVGGSHCGLLVCLTSSQSLISTSLGFRMVWPHPA